MTLRDETSRQDERRQEQKYEGRSIIQPENTQEFLFPQRFVDLKQRMLLNCVVIVFVGVAVVGIVVVVVLVALLHSVLPLCSHLNIRVPMCQGLLALRIVYFG